MLGIQAGFSNATIIYIRMCACACVYMYNIVYVYTHIYTLGGQGVPHNTWFFKYFR